MTCRLAAAPDKAVPETVCRASRVQKRIATQQISGLIAAIATGRRRKAIMNASIILCNSCGAAVSRIGNQGVCEIKDSRQDGGWWLKLNRGIPMKWDGEVLTSISRALQRLPISIAQTGSNLHRRRARGLILKLAWSGYSKAAKSKQVPDTSLSKTEDLLGLYHKTYRQTSKIGLVHFSSSSTCLGLPAMLIRFLSSLNSI